MMYHCMPIDLQSPLDAKLLQNVCHAELHELVHHKRNTPKNATVAMTTQVVATTSSRLGQVTCFISTRTSCRNSRVFAIVPVTFSPTPAAAPVMALPCDSSFFTLTACVVMNPRSVP